MTIADAVGLLVTAFAIGLALGILVEMARGR